MPACRYSSTASACAGNCAARNVRQHARGIDIDGVPAGRLDDRHAVVGDVPAQVAGGDDAVAQIVRIEHLLQAHGDGVQVAAGQAAVGRKAFGQDQQIGLLLRPRRSSFVQSKPPMLAKASFLAEKVQPSASENIFCAICFGVQSA